MPTPVRTRDLKEKKRRGEKIAMLTAYDANMARLLDRAGVDAILVGDSVGMVVLGFETTVPVTLDAMIHHTAAVSRGTERALIVADMPFLTYETTTADAVRNAGRLMQEGGAEAVKVEGGSAVLDAVNRLVDVGIPGCPITGMPPSTRRLPASRTALPPSTFTASAPPSCMRRPALRTASAVVVS